jgi:hypothetical protein
MPDDDEPGTAYADSIEKSLQSAGIDYRRISLAGTNCKDVSEYMADHSVEDIVRLIGEHWVHEPDGKRLTHIPFLPLAPYSNQDETKNNFLPATMHNRIIALQTKPGGL